MVTVLKGFVLLVFLVKLEILNPEVGRPGTEHGTEVHCLPLELLVVLVHLERYDTVKSAYKEPVYKELLVIKN